jgi:hypothetical protein
MKIVIYYKILLFIILLLPFSGLSQGNMYYFQEAKTWEFGPRIGFTTSIINSKGDPNIQKGIKMGLVGGLFARYQWANQWALQGDLGYSTRGNKNDVTNIQSGYVDFSIMPTRNIKYRMFGGDHTFDFFVGPGVSFLTSSKDKSGNLSNITDFLSSSEFNIVVGGSLPLGHFMLTATNRIGVSNLLGPSMASSESSWHSFTTEWTAAYRFK